MDLGFGICGLLQNKLCNEPKKERIEGEGKKENQNYRSQDEEKRKTVDGGSLCLGRL